MLRPLDLGKSTNQAARWNDLLVCHLSIDLILAMSLPKVVNHIFCSYTLRVARFYLNFPDGMNACALLVEPFCENRTGMKQLKQLLIINDKTLNSIIKQVYPNRSQGSPPIIVNSYAKVRLSFETWFSSMPNLDKIEIPACFMLIVNNYSL